MYFADEIRDPVEAIGTLPPRSSAGKQLSMAVELIEAMSGPWRPVEYKDSYTERVKKLVDTKRKGQEVVFTEEEPEATPVTDLVSALRASVEAARARREGGSAAKKTTAKKTPSKKTAARKASAGTTTAKKTAATRKTAKKTEKKAAAKKKAA
jgi:DNA end-binding protein Ku